MLSGISQVTHSGMQVEIDIDVLIANNLSADDYLALYTLYRKGFKTLEKLNLQPRWADLERAGYIKLGISSENHTIRQKFIDLFSSDFDLMFNELLLTYPMKVNTTNGIRVLHASDPTCKANKKARDKYRKVVGSKKFVHDRIIKLLNTQLKVDRNRLEYLQNLEVWINNHTWEKYTNLESDGGKEDNRITRKL
jgi:hypothetical protein